jgi:ABC-type Fe3+ transport system substrate-binding protein
MIGPLYYRPVGMGLSRPQPCLSEGRIMTSAASHFPFGLRAVVVTGVAALSLTACGSGGSSTKDASKSWTDTSALVAAAKKEGTLTIYVAPEYQPFLVKGFEAAYPWAKMDVSPQEPPQAAAKFQAELNSGVHQVDIVGLKEPELEPFSSKGAIAKVSVPSDKLVNPQLKDAAGLTHPMTATETALVYNTKLVSSGPKDLTDLAEPQWAGKLAVDDPLNASEGGPVFASERKALGDQGWDSFLAGLAKNKPSLTDSGSTSFEEVLRGDRAICLCEAHDYADAKKQGAPLGIDYYDQDGAGIVVTPTIAVVPKQAPHPAMAALFLNWVESPTGGQKGFIASGRSPVVKVPGVTPVVPTSVKEAPLFDVLGDYYDHPDSYNTAFKKYFG